MSRKYIPADFSARLLHSAICSFLAFMLISAAAHFAAAQSRTAARKRYRQSSSLRIGEVLNYRIDWRRFAGAATAQLQIVDRSQNFGVASWHFRATLHTTAPLRAFYPVDGQIDSYALPVGLQTAEYREHFREFDKPEDMAAALVLSGEVSNAPLPHVIVPQGTRDALSAIYFLRLTDWNAVSEIHAPVFDGENVYRMLAVREKREDIKGLAGNFAATKISIRLLDGSREIPDEHFVVWLANDPAQTPVLCEAHLPVGAVRLELVSDSAWVARDGKLLALPSPAARSNPPEGN